MSSRLRFPQSGPVLVLALGAALAADTAAAQTIALRWSSPSTITPDQASDVYYRQALGRPVSPSELFEADKQLRTDGSVSLGATVMTGMLQKLLSTEIAANGMPTVRIRTLDPVLQWAESSSAVDAGGTQVVRLRGETVQVAALDLDPNVAATVAYHTTINREWRLCGVAPCFTNVADPVREQVSYELSVALDATAPGEARSSELVLATGLSGQVYQQTYPAGDQSRLLGPACDPLPSRVFFTAQGNPPERMTFGHDGARTEAARDNRMLCGFFAIPGGALAEFRYLVGGGLAAAPSSSHSATTHNPLTFRPYEN